jgi:hypothetical protein
MWEKRERNKEFNKVFFVGEKESESGNFCMSVITRDGRMSKREARKNVRMPDGVFVFLKCVWECEKDRKEKEKEKEK